MAPHLALASSRSDSPPAAITSASQWSRLIVSVALIFALFHWTAQVLGSDRGQSGLLVAALVIAATFAAERLVFGRRLGPAFRSLGLGVPRAAGLTTVSLISMALLLVVPVFARVAGASVTLLPNWYSFLPGLFAQAGIAEEILFRGYLFGRLRRGRSFWKAAWLSMLPFVAVHLLLFFTMPWPVALAALLLAVLLSFPLAHLFELGGNTIWAPAILHFVIQGTIKVIVITGDAAASFPLVWMAASAAIPMFALLRPRRGSGG